jgi:3-oxoacyl-[acyl-carrier protein] reductase
VTDDFHRLAVITGAARGFGKAFAEALVADGARVVIADIDGAEAERTAAAIGPAAEPLMLDVADEAAVFSAMSGIAARHGGIDILINNAGIHSVAASKPTGELGIPAARAMFEVNVWGVIYCTLAAAPFMAERANASIVNISSMASYNCTSAYGVSKLAVRGLTVDFAHELAPQGIRVNAIAPGLMFTDTIRAELPEAMVKAVSAMQLLKREGTVDDIVQAMRYLVSPGASFITGECLRVSAGVTLQP